MISRRHGDAHHRLIAPDAAPKPSLGLEKPAGVDDSVGPALQRKTRALAEVVDARPDESAGNVIVLEHVEPRIDRLKAMDVHLAPAEVFEYFAADDDDVRIGGADALVKRLLIIKAEHVHQLRA